MTNDRSMPITIHAARSGYFVLPGVFVVIGGFVGVSVLRYPSVNNLIVALIPFAIALGFVAWLSRFELAVSHDALEYREGFGARQRVPLRDIGSAEIQWLTGETAGVRAFGPRLVVRSHAGALLLLVNAKPFAMHELQRVIGALSAPLSSAAAGTNRVSAV